MCSLSKSISIIYGTISISQVSKLFSCAQIGLFIPVQNWFFESFRSFQCPRWISSIAQTRLLSWSMQNLRRDKIQIVWNLFKLFTPSTFHVNHEDQELEIASFVPVWSHWRTRFEKNIICYNGTQENAAIKIL